MKYLKNDTGTIHIKDLGNGRCVAIQNSFIQDSISYEKLIHFAGVKLVESNELEMQKAWKDAIVKLMAITFNISEDEG